MATRIVTGFPEEKFRETVDVIITRVNKSTGKQEILLIRRGHEPFTGKWAFPGGHIEREDVKSVVNKVDPSTYYMHVTAEYAKIGAIRETEEEVGLKINPDEIRQVFTIARSKEIDTRGPTLTYVFHYELKQEAKPRAGDDAAECAWFEIDTLQETEMAFDHYKIIQEWLGAVISTPTRIVSPFPKEKLRQMTDIIITRVNKSTGKQEILLIERGWKPFKGMLAFPGGHIDTDDVKSVVNDADPKTSFNELMVVCAKIGAIRETEEEVGLEIRPDEIKQVLTIARHKDVDTRAPTLTHVFHYELKQEAKPRAGDDAAACAWYEIDTLQEAEIAFDHYMIIQEWLQRVLKN